MNVLVQIVTVSFVMAGGAQEAGEEKTVLNSARSFPRSLPFTKEKLSAAPSLLETTLPSSCSLIDDLNKPLAQNHFTFVREPQS